MAKFTEYRKNEQIQRLSFGPNDNNITYQSIGNDMKLENPLDKLITATTTTTIMQQSEHSSMDTDDYDDLIHKKRNKRQNRKIDVQFHLNNEGINEINSNSNYHKSRNSMPITSYQQKQMKKAHNTIREDEIKEFEGAHCYGDVNDDNQPTYASPPSRFFKPNLNPYPSNSLSSDVTSITSSEIKLAGSRTCPEKPKRLNLNGRQSRKFLTEAHFTGAYKNFEIQTPYFSEDSCSTFSLPVMGKSKQRKLCDVNSLDDDNSSQSTSTRYQTILNKNGDEVEYALPCIDQQPEYQRFSKPMKCSASDDEFFQEDPKECERILNENFEMDARESIDEQHQRDSYRLRRSRIPITDLDQSTDNSVNTLNELKETTSKFQQASNHLTNAPNRIEQYYESMQRSCSDIIRPMSEFIESNDDNHSQNKGSIPLLFERGVFKGSNVTMRRYLDQVNTTDDFKDYALITETAIIRDMDVLRYYTIYNTSF